MKKTRNKLFVNTEKAQEWNESLYSLPHIFLRGCPYCGTNSYMNKSLNRCHIWRLSFSSVTMRCKVCGLQFCVTWRSLERMIEKMIKKCMDEGEDPKMYVNVKARITYLTNSRMPKNLIK